MIRNVDQRWMRGTYSAAWELGKILSANKSRGRSQKGHLGELHFDRCSIERLKSVVISFARKKSDEQSTGKE